jgi:hypothetical protein
MRAIKVLCHCFAHVAFMDYALRVQAEDELYHFFMTHFIISHRKAALREIFVAI